MVAVEVRDPLFVAVIVYVVEELVAVGVPEIRPLLELIESPAGKAGEIDHDVAGPPVLVGDKLLIAEFVEPEIEAGV